jgi:hypothetical protein
VHFLRIISSDPKSGYNSGFLDTRIGLFREKILLLEVAFCNFLTQKYEISITKDKNSKKVLSILILEFQTLSKNA